MSELHNEDLEKVTGGADYKVYFNVILSDAGAGKMGVIKAVKEIKGIGLKEAKELVDAAPVAIEVGVSEAWANEIKSRLESVGARVELK